MSSKLLIFSPGFLTGTTGTCAPAKGLVLEQTRPACLSPQTRHTAPTKRTEILKVTRTADISGSIKGWSGKINKTKHFQKNLKIYTFVVCFHGFVDGATEENLLTNLVVKVK